MLRKKRPQDGGEDDWLSRVEDARDRLSRDPFVPLPLDAFSQRHEDRERIVAAPRPADRLIEEALLPFVRRAMEPLMSASVHGYRPGRSTFTAALSVSHALSNGYVELLMLDVSRFYESVDRGLLAAMVAAVLPEPLATLITSLMAAPYLLNGRLLEREQGIPPGRVLSPILANRYLVPLDMAAASPDVVYLRYGDDLLVAGRSGDELETVEARLSAAAGELGLSFSTSKRRRFRYCGEPFVYLGHALDGKGVYERLHGARLERMETKAGLASTPTACLLSAEMGDAGSEPQPNVRFHTLYLTEPGLYLKARSGLVSILRGKDVVREIPLHRIDRVLVLAGIAMTSGFLSACVARGIPVVFFVGRGKAYGCLVSGGIPNPLRLQSQYRLSSDPVRRMALGREIVESKLRAMLRRLAGTPAAANARASITELLPSTASAVDSASLRGVEGAASRAYYQGFAARVRVPEFAFSRRSRRPPRDPVNSLLSFAYSLLFAEMQTALLAHGLDPHPGLLHDLARNHPALASDLIEPYRILVADSFVLTLVNNGRVKPDGFERREDAILMNDETRRTVLAEYEHFMERPAGGAKGVGGGPRRLIDLAARHMLKVVLGEQDRLDLPLVASGTDEAEATDAEGEVQEGP